MPQDTIEFRASVAAEQSEVRCLLQQVFQAPDDAPFLSAPQLHWKYYQRRQDWPGSRSYVLGRGSHFVAHAAIWPMRFAVNGKIRTGIYPIDWAANSEVPGAGVNLLRELRELADFSICVGGTEIARKIIKRIGYLPTGEIKLYARPLRPWLQARTHQSRNWKLPARLVRNWLRTTGADRKEPPGWEAESIRPDQLPKDLFPRSTFSVTAPERSAVQFTYLAACPIARYQLYIAKRTGVPRGYFLLSFVPGQARIADSWVTDETDWEPLYRLALLAAFKTRNVAEITTASALKSGQRSLERCGFVTAETLPVMLYDPHQAFRDAPPIHFQMIDNDFSFLHTGRPEYRT